MISNLPKKLLFWSIFVEPAISNDWTNQASKQARKHGQRYIYNK